MVWLLFWDAAVRLTLPAAPANPWEAGAIVPLADGITSGEDLIIAVVARVVVAETPDGLGKLGVRIQQNGGAFPGFGENVIALTPTWKLVQIRTRANIDIAKGQAVLALLFGGAKQTVEINRVYVLKAAIAPAPAPTAAP